VFLEAGLGGHQRGMSSAMTIKDLFSRETDFDRPPGDHRQLRDHHLMLERIALASKTTAHRRGDYVYMTGRKSQNLHQRLMQIVQILGATVKGELAIVAE